MLLKRLDCSETGSWSLTQGTSLKTLDSGLILSIYLGGWHPLLWFMQVYNTVHDASVTQKCFVLWPHYISISDLISSFCNGAVSSLVSVIYVNFTGKGILMHVFVNFDLFWDTFVHLLHVWTKCPAWNPNMIPAESWIVHTLVLVFTPWRVPHKWKWS